MIAAPAIANAATAITASQRGWVEPAAEPPELLVRLERRPLHRDLLQRRTLAGEQGRRREGPGGVTPGLTAVASCSPVPGMGSPRSA